MKIIRIETKKDFMITENITREAFWNVYQPGCSEHYVLHKFRELPHFVPELSLVMELDGNIVAHIMYSKAEVVCDNGDVVPIVVFGPLSVEPVHQGKGYGGELIIYSMDKAKDMGFGAIAITGDPAYYKRFGFVSGSSVNVYYAQMPRNEEAAFFMVKELIPGYLRGVIGTYFNPEGYLVDNTDVDIFDESFPPKVKQVLPGQLQSEVKI